MKCLAVYTYVCLLLPLFQLGAPAQNQVPTVTGGSISGRITVGGKPAAEVEVLLLKLNDRSSRRTLFAKTTADRAGRYQFTGLAPGDYDVALSSTDLILPRQGRYGQPGIAITVDQGEAVRHVDLATVQSAVISGRVSDAHGRPVAGKKISFHKYVENDRGFPPLEFTPYDYKGGKTIVTDIQGAYRADGIPAGRYFVSVGTPYGLAGNGDRKAGHYERTFHPATPDQSRAIPVEVKEGMVLADIDITVGSPLKTYVVTGRIVGPEGNPLPRIKLTVVSSSQDGKHQTNTSGPWQSDTKGEFRIAGVLPGRYHISPQNDPASNSFGDPVAVDVTEEDVSGVEIKMQRGSIINGVVEVEGAKSASLPDNISQLVVSAHVINHQMHLDRQELRSSGLFSTLAESGIGRDGRFRIAGLRPGKARMSVGGRPGGASDEYWMLRIEHNGLDIRDGLDVAQDEEITGVRVVIGSGSGVIRGQLRVEGGQLEEVILRVLLRRVDGAPGSYGGTEIDSRGRFVIEKLVAGDYELLVGPMSVMVTGAKGSKTMDRMPTVRQTVTVRPGAESEVTLVLALRP